MTSTKRREALVEILKEENAPVSASALATKLGVSRQIIVGDVALLRAAGIDIFASPRGYILVNLENSEMIFPYIGTLACKHDNKELVEELYTIVDFGGNVIDVTIEHPLYGELSGPLDLSSRYDVDLFCQKLQENEGRPLCNLTGGAHLHRIGCRDQETFKIIKRALGEKGILFSESE